MERLACVLACVATLGICALTACQRNSWVDVDPSGCNPASVEQMNKDPELVRSMTTVCTLAGKAAPGDRLRCHGKTLQAACRQ